MKRVLVVYSWDDDVSERRHARMSTIAHTSGIEFEQCFALGRPSATVNAATLFGRIAEAIERFDPDILLIHTGAAFQSAPDQFVQCLGRLHKAYPGLRLGYEERYASPGLAQLDIFDRSETTQHAARVFFG